MPAGHTHTSLNLALVPIVVLAINQQQVVNISTLAMGSGAFIFATLFMSPDLDLFNSNPTAHWGKFKYLWLPYSKTFHHRGISHSLLFGSLTRIIYLSLVALTFTCLYYLLKNAIFHVDISKVSVDQSKHLYDFLKIKWIRYHSYVFSAFVGIWLADSCHICSDRIYSSIKGLKHGDHR
jgi:uncharacterized metal-binding protein